MHSTIISNGGHRFIHKPELPEIKGLNDYEGLKKRIDTFKNVEWQGCEVYYDTPEGRIVREAWIRNFEGMGASPLIIVQNIADLIIFYEIAKKYNIELPKDDIFNQIHED